VAEGFGTHCASAWKEEPCPGRVRPDPERLLAVWAGARDGLWDWDVASGEISFSPRWKEILGYTEGELPDRVEEWFRRVHPHDLPDLKRSLAEADGRARRVELELRMIHSGGRGAGSCAAARAWRGTSSWAAR
jgi:PAS domain-containing protein